MSQALSYDDVLLVPQYSDIRSRTEVSINTDLGNGLELRLPVIASPMDTISEAAMAIAIGGLGGAAIIHRYNGIEMQARMTRMAKDIGGEKYNSDIHVGAAVGISGDFVERAASLLEAGATFLCVDVAHGHHVLMKEAIDKLRTTFGDSLHIMAGNVATLQGINDIADWGADSIRCNIGGGSICSTRIQTGHGVPGLQTIIDCANTDRDVTIIADGGIRNSGDMIKAFACGADAVMCGSLLSGTDETPGKVLEEADGTRWKTYRGMASKEAQVNWRGAYSSYEGVSTRVPYRGTVIRILEDIERGIRSGLSYSGARNLREFQSTAVLIEQTPAGMGESKTHILGRKW
ncbi:MAG: guanosine monophosphate reductase [Flavobacteriaceae bacterium]|nr:guanosine monophosphate reductase [Flavobacteriaceae bacterium]|tara:strand:- start:1089 stop:2129 length:1041 start_codon:yes stop_codon:yes gene_type:complete